MQVVIDKDEWYPVYIAEDPKVYSLGKSDPTYEMSLDDWAAYRRALDEFEYWQRRLAALEESRS